MSIGKAFIGIAIGVVFGAIIAFAILFGVTVFSRASMPLPESLTVLPTPPAPPITPTLQVVQTDQPTETIEVQVAVLTKQVEAYTQEVTSYTQAVNGYTQQVAVHKTYLEASTADDTRQASAYTSVIKDTLLPIASTILAALLGFVFTSAAADTIKTGLALRAAQSQDERRQILDNPPKMNLFG